MRQKLFLITESLRSPQYAEIENPWELIQSFQESEFYVLFEYIVIKGKKKIFKGAAAKVSKDTLIDFVKKIIEEDIERPIRVIPDSKVPNFMLRIDDTTTCYFYEKNSSKA